MAAANASPRGQRAAILGSPLPELTDFVLTVDCRSAQCRGARSFAVAKLAVFYKHATVGEVLRRMRCSGGCGGRVLAAWLETGPILNARVRPRRVLVASIQAMGANDMEERFSHFKVILPFCQGLNCYALTLFVAGITTAVSVPTVRVTGLSYFGSRCTVRGSPG